jgi:hypothetical protein
MPLNFAADRSRRLTMTDDRKRKAAEAQFKKTERATEGAKAMADYKAEGDAERAKTDRLKAQRLAKEAAGDVAKQPKRMALSPDDPLAKGRSTAAGRKK